MFTWFRVGLLGVLLVGAGALYTPYPAELVKALTEDSKTTRKKKKRKKPTPPPAEPAPAAPVTPLPADTEEEEEALETEPWCPTEAFAMPSITLPPFPPALPERVEPGRYDHINSMTQGLNIASSVNFEAGSTASQDRKAQDAYQVKVSLNLRLPQAADGEFF